MKRMKTMLCGVLGIAGMCMAGTATARASLLGYEPFDYAAGSVSSASATGGTDWGSSHWSSDLTIASPGETYDSLVVAGNKLSATNTPNRALGASVTSGSVWLSFIGQVDDTGSELVDILAGFSGGVQVGDHFADVWQLTVGGTTVSTTASNETKSFLLARFDLADGSDNATGYLWVNPDLSAGEPSTGTADATATGTVTSLSRVKLEMFGTIKAIDEIRVGTTYADVTPTSTVPEPATLALLGVGGLVMLGRRRGRVC